MKLRRYTNKHSESKLTGPIIFYYYFIIPLYMRDQRSDSISKQLDPGFLSVRFHARVEIDQLFIHLYSLFIIFYYNICNNHQCESGIKKKILNKETFIPL
jgi:hypothetical protein